MANTVLTRTPSSASNRKTFTMSVWVKRVGPVGTQSAIMCVGSNPSSSMFMLRFDPDIFNIYGHGSNPNISTHRKFMDTSAWYHVVLAVDTTQASASDRVKLYVNGVQETSFSTASYPSQNDDLLVNSTTQIHIGERPDDNAHFEGYMSHFHFIDGTAYPASTFGETDTTTGEWKIKTSPSVTYGTNGFFILKDGPSVTDQSGNGNNFTISQGSLQKSEDNPSNNFCTLNLNARKNTSLTIANGATTVNSSNGGDTGIQSTMSPSSGKFYWEMKSDSSGNTVGIMDQAIQLVDSMMDSSPNSGVWGLQRISSGVKTNVYNNGTFTSYTAGSGNNFPNWGNSDVLQCAMDLDNSKIFFGKNGTFYDNDGNTGDPVNGTNPTFTITAGKNYTVYAENRGAGTNGNMFNFGNGYFGTTAVSSAGTNASGNGIFEYDVPAGFTALSTKGINSF